MSIFNTVVKSRLKIYPVLLRLWIILSPLVNVVITTPTGKSFLIMYNSEMPCKFLMESKYLYTDYSHPFHFLYSNVAGFSIVASSAWEFL